jgi:hypothetical protein
MIERAGLIILSATGHLIMAGVQFLLVSTGDEGKGLQN